jgi:hypothetical protein
MELGEKIVSGIPLLENCPYCSSCDLKFDEMIKEMTKESAGYFVHCCDCYASGPTQTDKKLAALKWNKIAKMQYYVNPLPPEKTTP